MSARGETSDAEFATLENGALVVDRSTRGRWRFSGARARETLTGLVTNDVGGLEVGRGCYAIALTAKGKVVADLRVFVLHDSVLVDTASRANAGWAEIVRKYINPRMTPYVDVTLGLADVGVFGPRAAAVIAGALHMKSDELSGLPEYSHREGTLESSSVIVARVPDSGGVGFELFVDQGTRAALIDRLVAAGAVAGGPAALEIARVEAGRPEWGLDMDDGTIPQEANADALNAISYTKGCYTGQETVARIHFRGHVNRHLRGLRLASSDVLPPLHAVLTDSAGKPVGDTRTAVHSPRYGPIALGMIRREVGDGETLVVQWPAVDDRSAGSTTGTVTPLPFALATAIARAPDSP